MNRFNSLVEFYNHFVGRKRLVTIEDIDKLEERLRSSGYSVKENKNGSVVVKTPNELEAARNRRLAMQKSAAAKYTKLGAPIPIMLAQEFSDACRKLGTTQSQILMPIINATIERANKTDFDD